MIVKKLAVPLINDKILPQAEYCYFATSAISETAFDFIRSRLNPKCKIDIVTGLDGLTSPAVLRKIWRHYQGRITLRIYTRNFFHANVFMFDLPFRKAVAFTGSGEWTMGGVKDHEELFYKISDPKEIEALKSWFTGYFEFADELTEPLIVEYEQLYPGMKQREIAGRKEKAEMIELTTRGFNWDTIKFKNQYFKKEDYLVFSSAKALQNTDEDEAGRVTVETKLKDLHDSVKDLLSGLGFYEMTNSGVVVNSENSLFSFGKKLRSMDVVFGRKQSEVKRFDDQGKQSDCSRLQLSILQKDFRVSLLVGGIGEGRIEREYLKIKIEDELFRTSLLTLLQALGGSYWIEVMGDRKPADSFQSADNFLEFIRADDWRYYALEISRNFTAGDLEIGVEKIASTVQKEAAKLAPIYNHLRFVPFEKAP